jgi:hypothetical protein
VRWSTWERDGSGGPEVSQFADLDAVLTLCRKLALTPAYGTVLAALVASCAPGQSVYTLRDRTNGMAPLATVDLAEDDPTTGALLDTGWADAGFAQSMVAESLKLTPPFPLIEFIGGPSVYVRGREGDFEDADYAVVSYTVDAVVFASGDQQRITARKALLYNEAFRRLIRKDESLGGLVLQMRSRGGVEPGGGGKAGNSPVVMSSRVRYDVRCVIP